MIPKFLTIAAVLAPLSALAHPGTDEGGHHGFLSEWLHSLTDAHYLTAFAAIGLSWALVAAYGRLSRARSATRKARGDRR